MKFTKYLILLLAASTACTTTASATSWNILTGKLGDKVKERKQKKAAFTNGGGSASTSEDYSQKAKEYELMARIAEAQQNGETLDLSEEDLETLAAMNPELAAALTTQREMFGGFNVSNYPFDDNELEWNEFKTDKSSAQILNGSLYIQNKKGGSPFAYSSTELPVNTQGDFLIAATVTVPKFEKAHPYMMFFNMEDARNTGVVYFDSETVKYVQFTDGVAGKEQSALINGKKGRNVAVNLIVKKDEGRVTITVNGDECLKIRKIDFVNNGFGFGVMPDDSIIVNTISCGNKIEADDSGDGSDD